MKKLPLLQKDLNKLASLHASARRSFSLLERRFKTFESKAQSIFDEKWNARFDVPATVAQNTPNVQMFWRIELLLVNVGPSVPTQQGWIGEDPGVNIRDVLEFCDDFYDQTGLKIGVLEKL